MMTDTADVLPEADTEQPVAAAADTGPETAAQDGGQHPEPIALVKGEALLELPKDLYIPPDALEVFLEQFEGPLDLLLYLIKKQNLDILDIPIVDITRQYIEYIELMNEMQLELAAEYLVMAAMLAEIKSRMLLPRPAEDEEDEEDPRAELIRRLQEYERYKKAAEDLEKLQRVGRDIYHARAEIKLEQNKKKPLPKLELEQLLHAFSDVIRRAEMFSHHHIEMEALSVRERMTKVLSMVQKQEFVEFVRLFDVSEGRMGVVVTFLAILELIKESLLEIVQAEAFAPIHIKAVQVSVTEDDGAGQDASQQTAGEPVLDEEILEK